MISEVLTSKAFRYGATSIFLIALVTIAILMPIIGLGPLSITSIITAAIGLTLLITHLAIPNEKPKNEPPEEFSNAEVNAAIRIQRAWRGFRNETTLNWKDLIWMHKNGLALRNQSEKKGEIESRQGGYGDAYSLATFGFDPDDDEFNEVFDNDFLEKIKKEGRIYAYFAFTSTKIEPKVKEALVKRMNSVLLTIISNCYHVFRKADNDRNMFHLINMGDDAQLCYKTNNLYPTGKCGKRQFNADQILMSIEEGLYLTSDDDKTPGVRAPWGGKRVKPEFKEKVDYHPGIYPYVEKREPHGYCLFGSPRSKENEQEVKRKFEQLIDSESRMIRRDIVRTIKNLKRRVKGSGLNELINDNVTY